jgi:hypothetical protein
VDARAGLHETTAAAVVGLGAEVLFFGVDQPQTFAGYELLFAHLATLSVGSDDPWRTRIHLIQAKAPNDAKSRASFSQRMELLLRKYLWRPDSSIEMNIDPSALKDAFEVDWTEDNENAVERLIDAESPPAVLAILDDDQFRSFDPLANRDILADRIYSISFGQLLEMAEAAVASFVDPERSQ